MSFPLNRVVSAIALIAGLLATSLVSAQEKVVTPGRVHYRAKQIMGATVSIEADTSIGIVDDIVFDDYGNVDYLIVINSEGRLVTIPWDATKFNPEKRIAYVPIAPERFRAIPTYTVKEYPVFSTPAYRTQVYKYYGLTPAEERRMIRRGAVVVP